MAAFYEGQRARIVSDLYGDGPHRVGLEGRITHIRSYEVDGFTIHMDCLDADEACHPSELEPILYDGNQLVSWESCLWTPPLWTPNGGVAA